MTFTEEEEQVLKLMIAEIRARKKLDKERMAMSNELHTAMEPLRIQISTAHKDAIQILQNDYNDADTALKEVFE